MKDLISKINFSTDSKEEQAHSKADKIAYSNKNGKGGEPRVFKGRTRRYTSS